MNFLSMEYFLIIAEEGSFSRASGKLFVSQQSLSEHVKKLETELGVQLLNRGRTLTLTEAGRAFLQGAKEMLDARNRMIKNISGISVARKSIINIGVATYDTPSFLPGLLALYTQKYPQNEPIVVKRQANDIAHNMAGVDLNFSWMPMESKLEHIVIKEDYYVAVVNRNLIATFYGARWPDVERELLTTQNLAVIKDMNFIDLYDRMGQRAKDLDIILKSYGIAPNIGFQSENADLNAEMCVHGVGVLISPQEHISRKLKKYLGAEDGAVSMYRIKTPGLECAIALSYEPGKKLNLAERQFIEVAQEYLLGST